MSSDSCVLWLKKLSAKNKNIIYRYAEIVCSNNTFRGHSGDSVRGGHFLFPQEIPQHTCWRKCRFAEQGYILCPDAGYDGVERHKAKEKDGTERERSCYGGRSPKLMKEIKKYI